MNVTRCFMVDLVLELHVAQGVDPGYVLPDSPWMLAPGAGLDWAHRLAPHTKEKWTGEYEA